MLTTAGATAPPTQTDTCGCPGVQMLRLFGASLTVAGLCMPNLQHVAIYLEPEPSCAGAHFQYNPQDNGTCKILSQVGSMVAAGIWPSLTQARHLVCL